MMKAHRVRRTDSRPRICLVRVPVGGEGCQQTRRLSALALGYDCWFSRTCYSPGGSRLSTHGVDTELLIVDG